MNILEEKEKLYGSIKLDGETVFYHHISQDKEKIQIYKDAIKSGKINNFDQDTISKLRRMYYGFYSGLIYIYKDPTTFHNIGNKMHVLAYALSDKNYKIVHGYTDSTRDIPFFMYGVEHLDSNSWIEVEEGNKVWVYDLFSLLKIEKNVYEQLEHPTIKREIPKEAITSHPAYDRDEFRYFHDGFIEILLKEIPILEKNIENHPYKEILAPELVRYKQFINYDERLLKFKIQENEFKKNMM